MERPGCTIIRFHSRTYVSGFSKLATLAIVIRKLMRHSNFTFYDHKFTMLNAITKFYEVEKT